MNGEMGKSYRLSSSLCVAYAVASGVGSVGASETQSRRNDSQNTIEFEAMVENDRGRVRCALFREKGWLEVPVRAADASISGKRGRCIFAGVPAGTFGISAFHDENVNGKLDTNFLGMPTEDYCASRGARGSFGPPSFEDAKFSYRGGKLRLACRMD